MFQYIAFELGINSELPLPELVQQHAKTDVTIRLGNLNHPTGWTDDVRPWIYTDHNEILLYWGPIGAFLVRHGQEIIVDPDPAVPAERLRLYLLGSVIGLLLYQRGLTVFHASAVVINGGAAAFIGDKGWGKSTMAVTLHASGHSMIADDVLAIDATQDCALALPGIPQMKLWPDSLSSVGMVPEAIPRLHPMWEKRDFRVTNGFSDRPVSLHSIYVLDKGSEPALELLQGGEAILELLRHWYCARFGLQAMQRMGYATHFLQCAELARRVSVYRLKRPPHLAALSEVIQLVAEQSQFRREDD